MKRVTDIAEFWRRKRAKIDSQYKNIGEALAALHQFDPGKPEVRSTGRGPVPQNLDAFLKSEEQKSKSQKNLTRATRKPRKLAS